MARARLVESGGPRIDGLQVIFRMQPTLDSTMHAGGRLVFAFDGKLFVVLGERSIPEGRKQARDLASHFGKIVRILPDGSVPDDNPFVGRSGARPEIWSSGHRNILSAALDEQQRLWIVEKIHESTQGPGLEQPIYYWDPVISPSGPRHYSGKSFPEWKSNLFVGSLSQKALVRLVVQNDRVVGEEHLPRAARAGSVWGAGCAGVWQRRVARWRRPTS